MSYKLSKAARNKMNQGYSFAQIFHNGKMLIYSGSAPANADDAATGSLLCTITDNSGTHTAEVLASGTISITGTTGAITAITINSISILEGTVAYNTSAAQTASDLATAINQSQRLTKYTAKASSGVVTLTAPPGSGTQPNTHSISVTTTLTVSASATISGGVAAANGIKFGVSAAGILSKLSTQTWSGVNSASGTAGYFRIVPATADAQALDSAEDYPRFQGDIATSGAAFNIGSASLVSGATTTVNSGSLTQPAGT